MGVFEKLPDEVKTYLFPYFGKDIYRVTRLNSYWSNLVSKELRRNELIKLCQLIKNILEEEVVKNNYCGIVYILSAITKNIDLESLIEDRKLDIKNYLTCKHDLLIRHLQLMSIKDVSSLNINETGSILGFSNFINFLTLKCIINAVDFYYNYFVTQQFYNDFIYNFKLETQAYSLFAIFKEDCLVNFNDLHSFIKNKFQEISASNEEVYVDIIPPTLLYLKIISFLIQSEQYDHAMKIFNENILKFSNQELHNWMHNTQNLKGFDAFFGRLSSTTTMPMSNVYIMYKILKKNTP